LLSHAKSENGNMTAGARLRAGFQLGEWLVRPQDGSLSAPAGTARIEPLLMELLVCLCSRAGQVVSKQDLIDAVWGGRFVSDETIKSSLYQLRKALDDSPRKPRFIETLPKRGYRMLVQPASLSLNSTSTAGKTEAEDLLRKGHELLSGQPNASLKQARLYFERATQADPSSAEALAALAHTYILAVYVGLESGSELFPRAQAAATRAVELDSNLAEAHVALGAVRLVQNYDFKFAEKEFQTAIQLKPEDPAAHCWYARLLSAQGKHAEAIAEVRRALQTDPLSLPVRRDLLETLFMARRFDETIAEAQHLFDLSPSSPEIQLGLVWIYHLQKREKEAFSSLVAGLTSLGVAAPLLERAQKTFQRSGMDAVLRLWVEVLEQQKTMGQRAEADLMVLHALLGNKDRFFDLLEEAHQLKSPFILRLPVSPFFDSLRSDRRYSRFVKRLGLPAMG
jgi:DNA-binding winged helix-turn-helix (wHTH) protein/Flp pilus assembly protein TadD